MRDLTSKKNLANLLNRFRVLRAMISKEAQHGFPEPESPSKEPSEENLQKKFAPAGVYIGEQNPIRVVHSSESLPSNRRRYNFPHNL